MSADALYVYAITEESAGADWGTGIDGRVVEPLQEDGLLALVHWMDATPYAGTDEQVRRWAVEHSQVVERAWEAAGTVLPVTFDVLVAPAVDLTAAERLRAWLRANAAMVRARLEAVRGRAELKIELAFDVLAVQPALARDAAVASARTELAGRPPGIRRLLEKKIEVAERAALEARAHDLSTSALRWLSALAEETHQHRPPKRNPGEYPVVSLSLLVARDRIQQVGAELSAIQQAHPAVRIRFLGPWPPYSFADLKIST